MHDIGDTVTEAGRGTGRRWMAGVLAAVALLAGLLTVGSPAQAVDLPWGPYTCATGYVWREAVPGDQVCVTPQTRSDTQTENALGPSRRESNGFCKVGFVWRETRPSDLVCVFPSSRDRAYSDNANAPWRLADPGATPRGGISVSTTYHQLGGYLYATGSGLSANRPVRFYAVRINTVGPYSLGSLTANASGAISGWQYVADIRCRSGQTEPAIVVVLDQGSGVVTTAGTTDAFRRCG
ncbi:hypothetical protein [Micromonospora sp. NBRC 101691]|uniref:hypothetical protein n=1 Tax=Micromonospora sp. NBRC 101691 TaxID=3032198 RepID=UPI0024A2B3A2|nr:hypothetical protein [Micromonospora sp. NBRC 101691]GLY21858.1 hypothetical protein Misp04_15900 [Micromonospora sp. NBRC 101691]